LIRLFFAVFAAGLLGARLNDKFARNRDMVASIRAEKQKLIPLIDGFIDTAINCKGEGLGFVRHSAQEKLYTPAKSFRVLLNGERLRLFNDAWEKFYRTTREEVYVAQPDDTQEQKSKMEKILVSRLEALRKIVSET
jgi:hypothetical protein